MSRSSRDGHALRELREAAGLSLGQVVKLTDYSKGHLSRVEHGERPATERLVRVYESLRERPAATAPARRPQPTAVPRPRVALSYGGEILRIRVTHGLSQRGLAEFVGVEHVAISRIENGHTLGPKYLAQLLDKRFGRGGALSAKYTAEANFAPEPVAIPGVARLSGVDPERPSDVAELAADAAVALEELRMRRHRNGAAAVVDGVFTQIARLHAAATALPAVAAKELRSVQARCAEYLSWLAEQTGDQRAMHQWLVLAVRLGSGSGDTAIGGYAAIRIASAALRADNPEASLRHIQTAQACPDLPQRLRLIALQRECRARARSGDRSGFGRAIEAYHELSEHMPAQPPASARWEWGPTWDPQSASPRLTEASGLLELEEFRAAADVFTAATSGPSHDGPETNSAFRHARVCFAIREATAYAHVYECDQAADVIEPFLPLASNESITMRRDLQRLASILSRRRAARLRDLMPEIITLAWSGRPRTRIARLRAADV